MIPAAQEPWVFIVFFHNGSNVLNWHLASNDLSSSQDSIVGQCFTEFHTLAPVMVVVHPFFHTRETHMTDIASTTRRTTSKRTKTILDQTTGILCHLF